MLKRFKGTNSKENIMSNSSTKNNLRLIPDYQLPDVDSETNSRLSKHEFANSKEGSVSMPISRAAHNKFKSKLSTPFAIQNSSLLVGFKLLVRWLLVINVG